jgi:four helix bundle protein
MGELSLKIKLKNNLSITLLQMEDLERIPTFFRFEDLRIYNKALEYIDWVHNTVKMFPEENGLGERYVKSAEAIALNIAEGSSRNKSQFVYYLKMAKSAVRECVVYTAIGKSQQYLDELFRSHPLSSPQLHRKS